jgi:hypothetical protein
VNSHGPALPSARSPEAGASEPDSGEGLGGEIEACFGLAGAAQEEVEDAFGVAVVDEPEGIRGPLPVATYPRISGASTSRSSYIFGRHRVRCHGGTAASLDRVSLPHEMDREHASLLPKALADCWESWSVARMARFSVRSGSLAFARGDEKAATCALQRTGTNASERSLAFAMQKVVGSSPIIRSPRAC